MVTSKSEMARSDCTIIPLSSRTTCHSCGWTLTELTPCTSCKTYSGNCRDGMRRPSRSEENPANPAEGKRFTGENCWRHWRWGGGKDHKITAMPSEDELRCPVKLCGNCGLRIGFSDDGEDVVRHAWCESRASDGATFISRISHGDARRQPGSYRRIREERAFHGNRP